MGTLATCWPRALWSTCGDSTGPTPTRASAISSAVRTAVPLGESTFVSRWVSTISIEGNNGAAAAANAVATTEPREKLGMKTAPVPAASTRGRTSAIRSVDHPEVPTSTFLPRSIAARTTSIDTPGVDASTTRSAASISARSLAEPRTATVSKSSSSSITPAMIAPSLPVPPTRATLVVMVPA